MKKNCASSTKNVLSECKFPVQYRLYLVFPLTALFLVGCAGFGSKVRSSRTAFESGDFTAAAAQLDKLLEKKDNDELAYLMELGLVYHTAGKYKEAIATFTRADKLADIRDYTSLTKEADMISGLAIQTYPVLDPSLQLRFLLLQLGHILLQHDQGLCGFVRLVLCDLLPLLQFSESSNSSVSLAV